MVDVTKSENDGDQLEAHRTTCDSGVYVWRYNSCLKPCLSLIPQTL